VADGRPFTPYGKVLAKLKEMDDACRGAGDLESSFTIGACIQQVEWLEQSESAPPTGPTPRCDALNKSADRAYWPKWAALAEELERELAEADEWTRKWKAIAKERPTTAQSETAPPTDVDELIAELKSALEELRIAGATPKCQRCDYPNCYCKDVPASTTGHKR
jgi:hypothetical protein